MPRLIFALALVLASLSAVAQQPQSPKREAIRQLILASVTAQAPWYSMAEPLIEASRKVNPTAAPTVWAELSSHVKDAVLKAFSGPGGPIERMVDSYDRLLSENEVRQLSEFMQSDLGRKFQAGNLMLQVELERDQQRILAVAIPEIQKSLASFYLKHSLKMP